MASPGARHNGPVRLFVAVEVPDDVADVVAGLERPAFEGLRWTTREQWHVTLRFLGEVPDPGPVAQAADAVPGALAGSPPPLEAVLGPVTAWFPGRHVLQAPVRGLDPLADALASALADAGLPEDVEGRGEGAPPMVERRPFVGHLTLARMRGRRPGPTRLAGVPLQAAWPVTSISVMASTLGAGGARYDTLSVVTL